MLNELLRRMLFLPPQASSVAREIDYLHYFVIITTMAGAAAITVVGLYFLIRYRARAVFRRENPNARPPRWAEVGLVAGLLSLFCLWWLIGFAQFVKVQVPPRDALPIYVTGKQWMWKFAYPDGERTIATLFVPAGRPVELLLTSRDVIHSFYVPDFRIKQDAVPGRMTSAWFTVNAPGAHLVMCAEYCGTSHSAMRAQVIALAPDDYARWLAGARRDAEIPLPPLTAEPFGDTAEPLSLVRVGTQVAGALGCLRCHTLDGSPHIGPTWAGLYRSIVPLDGGGTVVADEAYLTESMMDPMARLHAGFQAVMPSYHGLVTPAQIAAIIELIKSIRAVPGRDTKLAPLEAAASPEAAAGSEPAGAMERRPVQSVPAPSVQQGLPPPGDTPNPLPRLPISVGGARPVVSPSGRTP